MRTYIKTVILIFLPILCCCGCSSWNFSVEKEPTKEHRRIGVMEANLDDDLNATERKLVAPIFEKDEKERRRDERAVFGIDG